MPKNSNENLISRPVSSEARQSRPPVVVVMGHVDHGKSTLLDYVRKTNIVDKEFGGITQHISAYEVVHKRADGALQKITFLDTPGHEAFRAMRERGAAVADVAILVVSAEDGVKAQTLEALKTITESGIPYIVAINKIDKPNANIEKTKQNLAENSIFIEGYGGTVPSVQISAKKGDNIPELLEMILLLSDLAELTGDENGPAEGFVIESNLDQRKGITATVIIKNGTLNSEDCAVAGGAFVSLRMMENFLGEKIKSATFSSPVRIIGWSQLPKVGAKVGSCKNKKEAEVAAAALKTTGNEKTPDFVIPEGAVVIPLIVKTDVAGIADAMVDEISKLQTDKVFLKVLSSSAGTISENDVKTALPFPGAIIIGFNVKTENSANELAMRHSIEIKPFNVIYKVTEWLNEVIKERTPKVESEEVRGKLKILKAFSQTKDKQVVGGKVIEGAIVVHDKVRIVRRENEIGRGEISELQQGKAKTREVTDGECGVQIEAKITIVPGDVIESIALVTK